MECSEPSLKEKQINCQLTYGNDDLDYQKNELPIKNANEHKNESNQNNIKNILENIKSHYILDQIFEYIKSPLFKYKLIMHKKSLQKKLTISLSLYQQLYIRSQINVNLLKYLNSDFIEYKNFNSKLQDYLLELKLDNKVYEEYIIHYFEKYMNSLEENNISSELKIDIISPFFEILANSKLLNKLNIIIKAENLEDSIFKEKFKYLKNLKEKYSLTFEYVDNKGIYYFKDLPIDFNNIKQLYIVQKEENDDPYDYIYKDLYLKNVFLMNNIQNTLSYLDIELFKNKYLLNEKSIDHLIDLNNFKKLEYLRLKYFHFPSTFALKLKELKKINLENCYKILLEENTCLNLEKLVIKRCSIDNLAQINFPKLEECILEENNINIKNLINISSLKNLKIAETKALDLLDLENISLNKIGLLSDEKTTEELEKKAIQQLINRKNLDNLSLNLKFLENEDIKKYPDTNQFIKSLTFNWTKFNCNCILYSLQEKFINLTDLTIVTNGIFNDFSVAALEIKENQDCKTKNISIINQSIYHPNINCYCCPYDKLEKISFIFEGTMSENEIDFPIFKKECKVLFKSLNYFYFKNNFDGVSFSFLQNLYNNLDLMPNLKDFYLDVILYGSQIDTEFEFFYKKLIRKILSLKIINIHLAVRKNRDDLNDEDIFDDDEYQDEKKRIRNYSKREIKGIYPKVKIDFMEKIKIRKLKIGIIQSKEEFD